MRRRYSMEPTRKKLVIVGNADLPKDYSEQIDAADFVLRFNEPRELNGWSGTRIDSLMMCNSGKPMQLKLWNTDFLESSFFRKTQQVTLVYHPDIMRIYFAQPKILSRIFKGRRVDWTKQAIEIFGRLGKDIVIKSPQFYLEACAEINITGSLLKKYFPSTGYLGIWDCLRRFDLTVWDIYLCGFTWKGWKWHNWSIEEQWVRARVDEGKCKFL